MKRLFWTLFVLTLLVNCTPQQKLDRLKRNSSWLFPEKIVIKFDTIPAIHIEAEIPRESLDTSIIFWDEPVKAINCEDSIKAFIFKIDSLKKFLHYQLNRERIFIKDTTIVTSDSLVIRVKITNKKLIVNIDRPKKTKPIAVVVPTSLPCPPYIDSWFDKAQKTGFWILIVAILLGFIINRLGFSKEK